LFGNLGHERSISKTGIPDRAFCAVIEGFCRTAMERTNDPVATKRATVSMPELLVVELIRDAGRL
jgi:hypothetical protein